jgi:2-polyprenyl-6-methoxyphenol hydroxylase-like FAD-dependent oxidoreductase
MAPPTNVPKSVIIVGGSLAGLMHALTLLSLPSPPKVRILERSPTGLLHNQGAGIVAGGETQQFFGEYVRPGRDIAVTSPRRHYLNRKGDIMPETVEDRAQRMTSWDLLYNLLRWRVVGVVSDHVKGLEADDRPHAEYINGCTVTAIEETQDGVKVSWRQDDSEHSDTAALVLAADGASSTIRQLMLPDVKRTYAGYVGWRGTVPEDELSEAARKIL